MSNEHLKSKIDAVKGHVKEEVGHLTGNHKMESEGILERVKGKIEEGVGNVKDVAKKVIDATLGNHSHD